MNMNDSIQAQQQANDERGGMIMLGRMLILLAVCVAIGAVWLLCSARPAHGAELKLKAEITTVVTTATEAGVPIPAAPNIFFSLLNGPQLEGGMAVQVYVDADFAPSGGVRIRSNGRLMRIVQAPVVHDFVDGEFVKVKESNFHTTIDGLGIGRYYVDAKVPFVRGAYFTGGQSFTVPFLAWTEACSEWNQIRVSYHLGYPWGHSAPDGYHIATGGVDFMAGALSTYPGEVEAILHMGLYEYFLHFNGDREAVIGVEGLAGGLKVESSLPLFPEDCYEPKG